jgi:hypothetical protein
MTDKPPSTALAVRGQDRVQTRPEPWRDPEWQKFWLSTLKRTWSSLAIIPASTGAPPDFALNVAVNLARIGLLHLGVPIQVADGTKIPLVHLAQFEAELGRLKHEKELVLIALAPVAENPITVPLAQAADASVLCVMLDVMSSSQAKKTVNRIGPAHFLGSAMFHPSGALDFGTAARK